MIGRCRPRCRSGPYSCPSAGVVPGSTRLDVGVGSAPIAGAGPPGGRTLTAEDGICRHSGGGVEGNSEGPGTAEPVTRQTAVPWPHPGWRRASAPGRSKRRIPPALRHLRVLMVCVGLSPACTCTAGRLASRHSATLGARGSPSRRHGPGSAKQLHSPIRPMSGRLGWPAAGWRRSHGPWRQSLGVLTVGPGQSRGALREESLERLADTVFLASGDAIRSPIDQRVGNRRCAVAGTRVWAVPPLASTRENVPTLLPSPPVRPFPGHRRSRTCPGPGPARSL